MPTATFETMSSLGIVNASALTDDQQRRLALIERYDLTMVADRIRRKQLIEDDLIEEAVLEFRRFMALVSLGYRGLEVPCSEVDEVWHAFLLFTREYCEFCELIAGEFVHHCPPESRLPSANQGLPYLPVYLTYFPWSPTSSIQSRFSERAAATCSSQTGCHTHGGA